ncbi:hypothetical protein D9M71_743220 [compost metagenome]
MGDQGAVDQYVERLAGQAVEFDHRALVQLQQVANTDVGAADLHGNGHRNIQDHIQVRPFQPGDGRRLGPHAELFHRRARRLRRRLGHQRVDAALVDVTRLGKCGGPLIGQRLLLGGHVFLVCHGQIPLMDALNAGVRADR